MMNSINRCHLLAMISLFVHYRAITRTVHLC